MSEKKGTTGKEGKGAVQIGAYQSQFSSFLIPLRQSSSQNRGICAKASESDEMSGEKRANTRSKDKPRSQDGQWK